MKILNRNILPFQEAHFFAPLRNKIDYVSLIAHSARILLINFENEEDECRCKMRLIIDDMRRIFYYSENKFFSVSFPFNVILDNDGNIESIHTHSGIEINNKNISSIFSILNNSQFKLKPSPMDFAFETETSDTIGLYLVEEIFQFEPSYIRYDFDPANENGHIHPLHHFDINYSGYGTYKIGLSKNIVESYFEDILDIKTNCVYLH